MRTIILWMAGAALLSACGHTPVDVERQKVAPPIYPDYAGVTIPADVAPLDFNVEDADWVDVSVKGSRGGELSANGEWADFDIEAWQQLAHRNKGGQLTVTVRAEYDGQWREYDPFTITVSRYELGEWGLTYRRIPPGYEVGGDIGIYQRDLHSFDEEALLTARLIPGQCMNCHTANRTDPKELTLQVRGSHGGTLVMKDGHQMWLDTKTDSTKAAGSYASWHPDGRYVAYATNAVHQSFFTGKGDQPIEVYHNFSNIVLLDTRTNELLTTPQLMTTNALEIFPAFSADGQTLYYSTSRACDVPKDYEQVHCSIVALGFDAANRTFGAQVDTLLNGERDSCSYVLARPSYDGRWMMYCKAARSNFPIAQPSSDLWMMDLATRRTWPLDALNSRYSESYHNWSANSHWIVYSSKCEDGAYTRLYLAEVDNNGKVAKPFLLPQRNPKKFYHELMDAYNVPDFTRTRVDFDAHEAQRMLWSDGRTKVRIR